MIDILEKLILSIKFKKMEKPKLPEIGRPCD